MSRLSFELLFHGSSNKVSIYPLETLPSELFEESPSSLSISLLSLSLTSFGALSFLVLLL